jgi:hypothetical protein
LPHLHSKQRYKSTAKNATLLNGCSCEFTNAMAASHTVPQTAMAIQPRQPSGGLHPRPIFAPNQYRGASFVALLVANYFVLAKRHAGWAPAAQKNILSPSVGGTPDVLLHDYFLACV